MSVAFDAFDEPRRSSASMLVTGEGAAVPRFGTSLTGRDFGPSGSKPVWWIPFLPHVPLILNGSITTGCLYGCGCQNQWYHFGLGEFTTQFRLPILVVGLNRRFTANTGV